jgi:5-methylcytosine-specific restriction endonuclease McrA
VQQLKLNTKKKLMIAEKTNYRCAYCGKKYPGHIDHIIPLHEGGDNSINNLFISCQSCNCSKNKKSLNEWREFIARENAGWPRFNKEQLEFLRQFDIPMPKNYIFYFETLDE